MVSPRLDGLSTFLTIVGLAEVKDGFLQTLGRKHKTSGKLGPLIQL